MKNSLTGVLGLLILEAALTPLSRGAEQRVPARYCPTSPIVVEAEHLEDQQQDDLRRWYVLEKAAKLPDDLEGAGDPATWVQGDHSAASTASGNRFLRLLPDTRRTHADKLIKGENFSPEPGKMAVLNYPVDFPEPGRYYVWVRAFSTGSEDNGLHVGLDGQWPESGQRMQWCEGKNTWRWQCAQRTEQKHCGEPMAIYLDIAETGPHQVQFSMREDGFAFDTFLLTRDRDYRPLNEADDESPTQELQPIPAGNNPAPVN